MKSYFPPSSPHTEGSYYCYPCCCCSSVSFGCSSLLTQAPQELPQCPVHSIYPQVCYWEKGCVCCGRDSPEGLPFYLSHLHPALQIHWQAYLAPIWPGSTRLHLPLQRLPGGYSGTHSKSAAGASVPLAPPDHTAGLGAVFNACLRGKVRKCILSSQL